MLYYTAVVNGLIAPPLMIILLLISNNKKIMFEHTNSKFSNVLGLIITAVMTVAGIALIFSLF